MTLVGSAGITYFNGGDVGVLRNILVLVESILGQFALLLFDGKLDEEEHHGLKRSNGNISGSLAGDVFVEQSQGGRHLADANELLSPLENILGLLMRRRRL